METSPSMDLLQRQRTFSIDETREQLRQGRPVQKEAVIAGAVDNGSFYYGDGFVMTEAQKDNKQSKKTDKSPTKETQSKTGSWAGILLSGNMKSEPTSVVSNTSTKPQASVASNTKSADNNKQESTANKDGGKKDDKKAIKKEGEKKSKGKDGKKKESDKVKLNKLNKLSK